MMSEQNSKTSHVPLNVLQTNSKVEQLREQAAAEKEQGGAEPKLSADDTLISRFLDASKTPKQKVIVEKVIEAVRQVYDPEIPVNIYDLGLIYDIDVHPETSVIKIKMTLTAPGCGMGPVIAADAQAKIMTIEGIDDAKVELVWDPAWNQDMISEEGKMKLGMI